MKTFVTAKPKRTGELTSVALTDALLASGSVIELVAIAEQSLAGRHVEKLEFDQVAFDHLEAEASNLTRLSILDGTIDSSNFSGATMADMMWQRVVVQDTRMSGLICYDSILKDVEFKNCKLDMANLRACKLKNVRFTDCVLTEADFQEAQLTNVEFKNCDINKLDVSHCTMNNVDLRSSKFTEIKGVDGLAGATLREQQLISLAPILALQIGVLVED